MAFDAASIPFLRWAGGRPDKWPLMTKRRMVKLKGKYCVYYHSPKFQTARFLVLFVPNL
jgi:hypothetical protein